MLPLLRSLAILLALAALPLFLSTDGVPRSAEGRADRDLYDVAFQIPCALFALAGILGFRLSQARLVYPSLLFLLNYALMAGLFYSAPLLEGLSIRRTAVVASMALPLSLLGVFGIQAGRTFEPRGLLRLALLVGPTVALSCILGLSEHAFRTLLLWKLPGLPDTLHLPHLLVLLLLLLVAETALLRDRPLHIFQIASTVAVIPACYGLNLSTAPGTTPFEIRAHLAIGYATAGFVLLYGIYRLYWQKVYVDELTGILNRRALNEYLALLRRKYTIVMVDIDHFKAINDEYGHDQGDHVLRYVSSFLQKTSKGRVFRYGGEEFCLLYPGTEPSQVTAAAEELREGLSRQKFHIRRTPDVHRRRSRRDRGRMGALRRIQVTISVGVAGRSPDRLRAEDVLLCADKALYQAKNDGRNRVVLASPT